MGREPKPDPHPEPHPGSLNNLSFASSDGSEPSTGQGHSKAGSRPAPGSLYARVRRRTYEVLEVGREEDRLSAIIDRFLIVLIIANVLAFSAETVPELSARYGAYFHAFDAFSIGVFTIEYALRLWCCVEVPFLKRMPPVEARLRFAKRAPMVLDLLVLLPFYLSFLVSVDLRILRVLRLFRFLKLARYSPAIHTLVRVLYNERRALTGALLLMSALLLFAATGIYVLEHDVQPEKFGSVPSSAWWAIATLTTVGYGDVTPITLAGRLFAGLVMIMGLCMFALPIAIISTGFAQEVGRRDFVVTWSMLARVPLLAELDATSIARLMPHLHAHNYPPHWEVIAPGSRASSMYFVASGTIEVVTPGGMSLLRTGDFFGEIAMLENGVHAHAYTSQTRARVLRLQREDFLRLEHEHPEIGRHIREVAHARKRARAAGAPDPQGGPAPEGMLGEDHGLLGPAAVETDALRPD